MITDARLIKLSPRTAIPHFNLENQVLEDWGKYIDQGNLHGLDQLRIPSLLIEDFKQIKSQAIAQEACPSKVKEKGQQILKEIIFRTRALQEQIPLDLEQVGTTELSSKEWKRCLGTILERLQNETSYFDQSVTADALRITQKGLFSKQLGSMIVPIKNSLLLNIIKQPVFLPEMGIIIHPGNIPTAKEITMSLAKDGALPASFSKLQESVAEILAWPLSKRLFSFLVSMTAGLLTAPLKIAYKVLVFVPRVLGVSWLKKKHLPLSVDPVLSQTFRIMSGFQSSPHFDRRREIKHIESMLTKNFGNDQDRKIKAAVRSLTLLKALGCSQQEIGRLINGKKYNKTNDTFPLLEKEIEAKCKVFQITSSQAKEHLLDLDDSVWRLSSIESRLKAIVIAREEISKLRKIHP